MSLNRAERNLLWGGDLWAIGEGMLGPLFAVFTERIGGSILDISWAWATYLVVTGTLVMLIGRISDHSVAQKKRLMVLGYALNAIFTFAYLLVSSPFQLFFVQAGLGFATALASPTWSALYARYEDKNHSGFGWGLADGHRYILTGLALVAGGLIVDLYSFVTLFVLMGTIQTIAVIYQARILWLRPNGK